MYRIYFYKKVYIIDDDDKKHSPGRPGLGFYLFFSSRERSLGAVDHHAPAPKDGEHNLMIDGDWKGGKRKGDGTTCVAAGSVFFFLRC